MRRRGTVSHALTLVLAASMAVAFFAVWLQRSGALPGGGSYVVNAALPAASNLTPGSSVRIAGVRVGRVSKIERSGTAVVVRLQIDDAHAPLPSDSRVQVRLRTLVGENYIAVEPGRSGTTIPAEGFVPISQAGDYVEVDQILSALRGKTRERARQAIQSLGGVVGHRGLKLNALVRGAAGFVNTAKPIIATLDQQHGAVARLVDNVGVLSAEVGSRGRQLRTAAAGATGTLNEIAASDAAVRRSLRAMPGTLDQVERTSKTLQDASGRAAPVIAELAGAVTDLDPAIRTLRPASQQGRNVLRVADRVAPSLTTTLEALKRTAPNITAAVPAVRAAMCQLNPMAAFLRPYTPELAAVLSGLASTTNYYDASGHAARLYVMFSPKTLGVQTPETASIIESLLKTGILGTLGGVRGYDGYPAPGAVNQTSVGAGITGPGEVTKKYIRVQPRC